MSDQFLDVDEEQPIEELGTEAILHQLLRPHGRGQVHAAVGLGAGLARGGASLLQAALESLPDELRQARWLLREREEFMAERSREAEALMDEVRAQAEHMVQRTEIVRQANPVAQRILDDANEEARALRHEAEDFCDQKLAGMEIVLERLTRTVQAGRAKLRRPAGGGRDRGRGTPGRRRTASSTRTRRSGPALMAADPFVVHVARLRRSPGTPRTWSPGRGRTGRTARGGRVDPGRSVVPPGPRPSATSPWCRSRAGSRSRGTVRAPWSGTCRRCTAPVAGELRIAVRERFAEPRSRAPDEESTRSSTTPSTSGRWSATPSSSSCPWRPSAGRTAGACAPSAGPTATRAPAAALPRATPGGLTSTCSGRPSRRDGTIPAEQRPDSRVGDPDGRPEEEEVQGQGPQPPGRQLAAGPAAPQRVPALPGGQDAHVVCPNCGWYKGRQAVEVD